MTFTIEALARWHDRSQFACGVEALDRYIRRQASADARRRVARVFVVRPEAGNEVAGFYTLSAERIERETLPPEVARRLPPGVGTAVVLPYGSGGAVDGELSIFRQA